MPRNTSELNAAQRDALVMLHHCPAMLGTHHCPRGTVGALARRGYVRLSADGRVAKLTGRGEVRVSELEGDQP